MGKLKSLLTGLVLGAGGMYVGLQYHVVHAKEGLMMVQRMPQQSLQDAYADIRDWDATTWAARPRLALAVTEQGRGDLIRDGVTGNMLDGLRNSISPLRESLGTVAPAAGSGLWEPTNTTDASSTARPVEATPILPPTDAQRRSTADTAQSQRGFLPVG